MYIKVENNQVNGGSFELPKKYRLPDGAMTYSLDQYSLQQLKDIGIFPLVDNSPTVRPYDDYIDSVYTINEDFVELVNNYVVRDLALYKKQRIGIAYNTAKELINSQSEGYALAEIATWPAIQSEVLVYNVDSTDIGAALQSAADSSAYSVAELSSMLTPRITLQMSIIANRAALVSAINGAADHAAAALVNINNGW